MEITGYLDTPIPGQWITGYGVQCATKENPVGGMKLFDLVNRARDAGHTVTLVTEGPDAEEAMRRIEDLLEQPATAAEAVVLGPTWLPRCGWSRMKRGV